MRLVRPLATHINFSLIMDDAEIAESVTREFHIVTGKEKTAEAFVDGFDFVDCVAFGHGETVSARVKNANEFSVI